MTAILERRESESLWGRFCNWITIALPFLPVKKEKKKKQILLFLFSAKLNEYFWEIFDCLI
jgi:hypothetical protein